MKINAQTLWHAYIFFWCKQKSQQYINGKTLRPVNIIHGSKYSNTFAELLKQKIEYLNTVTLLSLFYQLDFKKKEEGLKNKVNFYVRSCSGFFKEK